jgi:hypothetical protein
MCYHEIYLLMLLSIWIVITDIVIDLFVEDCVFQEAHIVWYL